MKKIAIILGVLIVPTISFAAPSISSVGGTFNHGNSITITGSGFGEKSPAKPLIWAPFEGGKIAYDASLSSGDGSITVTSSDFMEISSSDLPHSRSLYSIRGIPWTGSVKRAAVVKISGVETKKIFIFNRRKYGHSTFLNGVTNYKTFRAWPATDIQTDFIIAFSYYGAKRTNFTNEGTMGLTSISDGYVTPNNVWFTEELQLDHGDIDVANASATYWVVGKKYSKTGWTGRTAAKPDLWSKWYLENNWTIDAPPANAYVSYDDIYSDITWSRVMIGNASTYDACTQREPLIPTVWSASSITAYFNQGSFANGQSVYVFVVDSSGNVSSGNQIKIGGAAAPAPAPAPPPVAPSTPNPPANLTIN